MIKRVGADLRATFEAAFGHDGKQKCRPEVEEYDQQPSVQRLPGAVEAAFASMSALYEAFSDDRGKCGSEENANGMQLLDRIREVAKALVDTNAPYLLRYVFVRDLLRDLSYFAEVAPILEERDYVLNWGGSHEHRMAQILPRFDGAGFAFVDIGCGPGAYLAKIAPRYAFAQGYEKVRPIRELAKRRLESEGIFHVDLYGAFGTQSIPFDADVLITEVLEHMPYDVASGLLRAVLRQKPRRVVVTVPNRAFNRYYCSTHAYRHEDHDWEPDAAQFEAFVLSAAGGLSPRIDICGIGDRAHGESSSLLAQLEF